jgi:hypothetical protein
MVSLISLLRETEMFDDIIAEFIAKFGGDSTKDKSFTRWFFLVVLFALIVLVAVLFFLNN